MGRASLCESLSGQVLALAYARRETVVRLTYVLLVKCLLTTSCGFVIGEVKGVDVSGVRLSGVGKLVHSDGVHVLFTHHTGISRGVKFS